MSTLRPQLLHVEDDQALCRALRRHLSYFGRVVQLGSVQAACEFIAGFELIDFLLLDLSLPDGSGVQVLNCLRRHRHLVPVIVLTALEPEDAHRVLRGHLVTICRKPIDVRLLRDTLMAMAPQRYASAVEHFIRSRDVTERRAEMLRLKAHGASSGELVGELGVVMSTVQGTRGEFRGDYAIGPEALIADLRRAYAWPVA